MQDFALGVSLFLVTVTFVLGLFPGFLAPFTSGTNGAEQAQADRVAGSIVLNLSTSQGKNTLNATELGDVLAMSQSELRDRYGLDRSTGLNITVRKLDGHGIVEIDGQTFATPRDRNNQTAASVSRIITLDNRTVANKFDSKKCDPGCRLVVKVW